MPLATIPKTTTASHRAMHKQRGVGLIELLVAVVILSIGFLAVARMQVQGMRFSQNAYFKSQAYFLASDIMNRMRSNIDAVYEGHYDNLTTSSSVTDPGCQNKVCTTEQLAQQDNYDWSSYFHPLNGENDFIPVLPSSDAYQAYATIEPLSDNNMYAVKLFWSEINSGENEQEMLQVNVAMEQPN